MPLTFVLAWRNIWRQPRRTWLTTGAMIFSNVLLVFMISLQFGMYQAMIENNLRIFTGHLQVQAEGYNDEPRLHKSLPEIIPLAAQLRQHLVTTNDAKTSSTVKPAFAVNISARASGFALASSAERSYGVQVVGVEPEFEPQVSSLPGLIKEGRYLEKNSAAEVVVGKALARNLKLKLGDELTLMGSGRDGSFAADVVQVVGIFESGVAEVDRNVLQMPLLRFQEMFSMEGEGHSVVILSEDFYRLDELQTYLTPFIEVKEEALLLDWNRLIPGLQQAIDADMLSAWFMYGVLITLVAFSVLNTQLMSVLERTHEFGIVLALGLRPGRLARLVILESMLLAGIGLVIGLLLGSLLVMYLSQAGFYIPGMEEAMAQYNLPGRMYPSFSFKAIVIGPAVVFCGCLLASLYPALRLQFLQPVAAMRSV